MRALSWGALLLLVCACSSNEKATAFIACVDGDVRCGATCSDSNPCAAGLYCTEAGTCAKQCVTSSASGCADGGVCTDNGKCLEPASSNGGDGGGGGRAGGSAAGNSAGGQGGSKAPCAQTTVSANRVQPTVILIVDQSGSMGDPFGGGRRWDVLRDALLAKPDGLIFSLQSQVRFGLALYTAQSEPDNDENGPPSSVGPCPAVQSVAPAIDNYMPIANFYNGKPYLDDTPTGDSINKIIDDLDLAKSPSTTENPIVFVVATDGEPDRCENLDPSQDSERAMAKMESVAAVQRAFSNNIRTYMISVGGEISDAHMTEMANAGLGRGASGPAAEWWEPLNDQSLRAALTEIIGGEVSCDITLEGEVQGDHCLGRVELNGKRLTCDDPNGWELADSKHIKLLGSACTSLKNDADAKLSVSFPCQVKVIRPQ